MLEEGKLYKNISNNSIIQLDRVEMGVVHCRDVDTQQRIVTTDNTFLKYHLPYIIKNVNHDIIKLIESGYQFISFYGKTADGKEFHVDMET